LFTTDNLCIINGGFFPESSYSGMATMSEGNTERPTNSQ